VDPHINRLYVVGCGDSLSIAIAAQPLLERLLGFPCQALEAFEYVDYMYRVTDRRTAVVGISSSGTTPRTVEALLRARSQDALTIGVSNSPDSPVLQEARYGLCVPATRKGWPTQATTAAMAMVFRLGIAAGRVRGVATAHLRREMAGVPNVMEGVLRHLDDSMAQLASGLVTKPVQLFSGGGQSWATALIGAAKVRECTVKHAVALHVEEYHHYNSQKAGDPLFLIAPPGPSVFRAIDAARSGHGWRGLVYVLTGPGEHRFHDIAEHVFEMPTMSEELSPLVYSLPLQLFAYHLSIAEFSRAASSA
jgi:glucosamine 6-phosphate synthetase-like amidotransferase/phosphosugar isomerase protein